MKDNSKLIVRATVMKQITEEYVLDCTGMTMDEVKEEMTYAYVEDRSNWEWVNTETDHHEISMELEIQ
jgi:hypothetical protein